MEGFQKPRSIRTFRRENRCTHLVAHFVQIRLELIFHVFGQIGAAGPYLLHLLPLPLAGEVKGELIGEQVVDLVQETPGHRFDPVQRMSKFLLALPGNKKQTKKMSKLFRCDGGETGATEGLQVPGVGGELLLQHDVLPADADGLLVVLVSLPDGDVSLLRHVLNRAGEVGLDEADHGFLLGVEGLQGLHLSCTGEKRAAVKPWSVQDSSSPGDLTSFSRLMAE